MNKKLSNKLLKVAAIVLLLLLIALLALRTSYVQNKIKSIILSSLSESYDAKFTIGHIFINGFDEATIDQLLLLDQKNDTLLYADHIKVDIGLFNLFNKQIWLEEVEITDVRSKLYNIGKDSMNFTFLFPEKDTVEIDSTKSKWLFGLSKTILHQSQISYKTTDQNIEILDDNLTLKFDEFDLENKYLKVDLLESSLLSVLMKTYKKEEPTTPFALPFLDWNFVFDEIKLRQANFQSLGLQDTMSFKNISTQINTTQFYKGKLTATVKKLSGNYGNIILLQDAQASISLDSLSGTVQKLNIKTTNDEANVDHAQFQFRQNQLSLRNIQSVLSYPTIQLLETYIPANINIQKNIPLKLSGDSLFYESSRLLATNIKLEYGNVLKTIGDFRIDRLQEDNKMIDVDIQSLSSNFEALDQMLRGVTIPKEYKIYKNIRGSAKAIGSMNGLNFQKLDLQVDKDITLKAVGELNNINDMDLLNFNLKVTEFKAPAKRLPIPPNEKIAMDSLGNMKFSGSLIGELENLKIKGLLNSSLGALKSDIKLVIPKNFDNLGYKGNLVLQDFKLGTLLKNNEIGAVSFDLNLDGKGTTLPSLNTAIEGSVSAVRFRDYLYKDIFINANISESTINGKLRLEDENVKLDYDGQITIKEAYSVFNFDLNIDTLKTQELDLFDKPLYLSGKVHAAFQVPIASDQQSILEIRNFNMSNVTQSFHSDSIQISGNKKLDTVSLQLTSNFGNLAMKGVYTLQDLPKAFEGLISQYWPSDSTSVVNEFTSKNIQIIGKLSTLQPIAIILQDSFLQARNTTIDLNASFADHFVKGNVSMDSFLHQNILIEKLNADVSTEKEMLTINLSAIHNQLQGRNVDIIAINNQIKNKKIASQFIARDGDNVPRLEFEFFTTKEDKFLNISMRDSFILNQKDWLVNEANSIKIYGDRVFIDKFAITDNDEFLTVQSTREGKDINVDFKNFEIGQFTTLLTSKPSQFTGKVNGVLDVKDIDEDIYFITNLKVDSMIYDSTAVGELNIAANANPTTKVVTTDFTLKGPTNDVKGGGKYNTASKIADFDVDLKSLDILILNPFLSQIMVDSKGTLSGKASFTGNLEKPSIQGVLTFDTVSTTIVANNSQYQIDNHTITFDNNSIDIGNLKIKDVEGNIATLTGKINHNFLDQINMDIHLKTDKFVFLNTSSEENPVFFGKIILNASANITGNPSKLKVDVVAKTLKNTTITLSPFAGENVLIEEQFLTYGKPQDFEDLTSEYLLKLNRAYPFDVDLLLNATKEAKFTFVIDPISGDKIEAIGGGDLKVKLKPDGNQEIYGIYTVDEGAYYFSYGDFVNKTFTVKKGGTVKFEGNPLNAVLDIDAVYDVYTTTYELIKNEVSISETEAAAAKKRTTVKVYLSLKGTLDNPSITLNIEVPDLQSTNLVSAIDRKLEELRNNPNELNNQVFGLLIFDSFILSDNASSGFDNFGNNIALKSLSTLVSSQLNRLANNFVKGVDVNVNVNSYESGYVNGSAGGNVTEVGLKVSKQLFNDRLSVSAGGNLDINQGATSGSGYSSFIGDFVLNYKLTDDGRYQIKVFSKSDYDRLLNANTNRNGISIFFNQSFDSKTDAKK